ncbi:YbjQ family protein [Flavobacterium sp.]|uniref:YbjQ family protein n=1 Tax=Flavobacterium sp. TaxID=239 RepID=UPI002ED78B40
MKKTKNVLAVTTSTVEGLKIQKYLKPISSHLVAGTNFFSDFFGGITDIIGGRSSTYQKQLTSLYDEAVENLKKNAVEIGANCIIGLHIDLDEISGKGKSMFMVSAIGTAVILEDMTLLKDELPHEISSEQIKNLNNKKKVLAQAKDNTLKITDDVWNLITVNQIIEVYPFVISKLQFEVENSMPTLKEFRDSFLEYVESFDEVTKKKLLYDSLGKEENITLGKVLIGIVKDLYLLDFLKTMELIKSENLIFKKRGLMLLTFEKQYYNQNDIQELTKLISVIDSEFSERGKISSKKQLLSSKERQIWTCECNRENDLGSYCGSCFKDIYGFEKGELNPEQVVKHLEEKTQLITELIE